MSTEVAGAFLNLEPLVGALIGVIAFSDPAGPRLALGGVAILGGILMSSLQALHRHGDSHGRRRGGARLATVH